jgi:hypothetical protein
MSTLICKMFDNFLSENIGPWLDFHVSSLFLTIIWYQRTGQFSPSSVPLKLNYARSQLTFLKLLALEQCWVSSWIGHFPLYSSFIDDIHTHVALSYTFVIIGITIIVLVIIVCQYLQRKHLVWATVWIVRI